MVETKKCSKCKEVLPASSFNKLARRKDGLQSECKECKKKIQDAWYKKNAGKHYEKVKSDRNLIKKKLFDYLSDKQCLTCNESDPVVFEFDHRDPSTKEYDVAYMVLNGFSWKRILEEIDKCDILCSNCHRKKTARDRGYYKFLNKVQ